MGNPHVVHRSHFYGFLCDQMYTSPHDYAPQFVYQRKERDDWVVSPRQV